MNTIQEILEYAKNPPEGISQDQKFKCKKIVSASHLHNPELFPQLPAKFSNIFQLSLYSEEDFFTALEEGVITPNSSFDQLQSWRTEKNGTRAKDQGNYEIVPVAVFVRKGDSIKDKVINEIKESLYFLDAEVLELDKVSVDDNEVKFKWRKNRLEQVLSEGKYDPEEFKKLEVHIERIKKPCTKHQRHYAKVAIKKLADSGNVLAFRIYSEVYGEE